MRPEEIETEAAELADAVEDYGHFGEMVHALRVSIRAMRNGTMQPPEGVSVELALKRLRAGTRVLALARELWIANRL